MTEEKEAGKEKEEKKKDVSDRVANIAETKKGKIAKKKAAVKKVAAKKKTEAKEAKAKETKIEGKITVDKAIEPFDTIQFVLMTEKAVRIIESQNKLVFVVRRNSEKKQIKKAVEDAFQSPVSNVRTMIDQKGRKRAFVKFSEEGKAGDIAIRLGII